MAQELHDVQAIGAVLLDVAVLAISLQDYEVAGELLGAVAGLAESNEFALGSLQVDSSRLKRSSVLRRQCCRSGHELDRSNRAARRGKCSSSRSWGPRSRVHRLAVHELNTRPPRLALLEREGADIASLGIADSRLDAAREREVTGDE